MKIYDIILAITVIAFWSGNFIAAKYGLDHFAPFQLLFWRFVIVAALLMPFAKKPKNGFKNIAILSLVLCTIHFPLLFYGVDMGLKISAAVIAVQLGVPFSCMLGTIMLSDKLGMWRTMGIVIAFFGIVILAGTPSISEQFLAFIISCVGAFFWGLANIYFKYLKDESIMNVFGWSSLFAIPQLFILTLIFEPDYVETITSANTTEIFSVLYTAIFSTIVGYGIWYYLLKKYEVSQVAPFSLLVPFFGISFANLFFGEEPGLQLLIGGVFTIIGVSIIIIRRPKTGIFSRFS